MFIGSAGAEITTTKCSRRGNVCSIDERKRARLLSPVTPVTPIWMRSRRLRAVGTTRSYLLDDLQINQRREESMTDQN